MKVKVFAFSPYQENTYVLYDDTQEAVIVDCGAYWEEEQQQLLDFLKTENLKVVKLLHTHLHLDHIFGYEFTAKTFNMLTHAHREDQFLLGDFVMNSQMMGLDVKQEVPQEIGTYLEEGDTVSFGNTVLHVLHVPGHTPGHICFFHKESNALLAGDCLFRQSIGRTDFPYSDHETLLTHINSKLLTLPDATTVYSGHGPTTTIGWEKQHNPFLS